MSDTDERARFGEWWTGRYGPYSIRAEWADTPTDAAWMAWRAQAEENALLRAALERMLLEFDFMVERGVIPDVRNDIIFVEARAALAQGGDK